jgi:hypothetical protein
MDIADARLSVLLQLSQRRTNTLPVRQPHPVVATHEGCNRHRLRRGKCAVPSGAMFHAGHFFAILALIRLGGLVPDELSLGLWVPAFAQPREVLGANFAL